MIMRRETTMSIKSEIESRKEERKELAERLKECERELRYQQSRLKNLDKKNDQLKGRESLLAQTLRKRNNDEIAILQTLINSNNKTIADLRNKINEIDTFINSRMSDTQFYIDEQVSWMVQGLLEYIRDNFEELGENIKTTFCIAEERDENGAPTGKISISLCPKGDKVLFTSDDFYFTEPLYTVEKTTGIRDNLIDTKWFKSYFKNFYCVIFWYFRIR